MRDFGIRAERCHSLPLPKARVSSQPKYTYHCACRTFDISSLIHGKMQRGQVRRCVKCRVSLTFGPKAEVKKESPYPYV
jgi:predicted SprT family Zn-dependent metalloprotease